MNGVLEAIRLNGGFMKRIQPMRRGGALPVLGIKFETYLKIMKIDEVVGELRVIRTVIIDVAVTHHNIRILSRLKLDTGH